MIESDSVIFFNNTFDYLYKINKINKKFIVFSYNNKIQKKNDLLGTSIIIPYIKQEKMIIIAKQAIEFGCNKIYFTIMDHSIKQTSNDKLYKNMIEALEQSNGNTMPEIFYEQKLLTTLQNIDNKILCGTLEKSDNKPLNSINDKNVTILIGPEGGFSEKEEKILKENKNVININLGNRILRCETASAALLGIASLYC